MRRSAPIKWLSRRADEVSELHALTFKSRVCGINTSINDTNAYPAAVVALVSKFTKARVLKRPF
jgi:hypothetical protein